MVIQGIALVCPALLSVVFEAVLRFGETHDEQSAGSQHESQDFSWRGIVRSRDGGWRLRGRFLGSRQAAIPQVTNEAGGGRVVR